MQNINFSKLQNNITVASDEIKDIESVSVYVCANVGGRSESQELCGISHFLEHMAFKGTHKRTYKEIAEAVDNVGGIINAYTGKESTCYYIKVIKKDIELAFDILSDILENSTYDNEELEKERGVILQELAATLDNPSDVIFDMFYSKAFEGVAIGRTILGPAENIKKFQKQDFINYVTKYYKPSNMIVSVAGNANYNDVLNLSEKYFGHLKDEKVNLSKDKGIYSGGKIINIKQDLEQVQFVLGFESCAYHEEKEFYASQIASSILGDGMSSRLFQEIREKKGLVYTISTITDYFDDSGLFAIYAGTSPDRLHEFCETLNNELYKFVDKILDSEMQKTINQFEAGLLMSLESSSSRASKLIYNILRYGRYISHKEIIEKVKSVTKADVINVIYKMLNKKNATLAIYGNVKNENYRIFDNLLSK